MAGIQADGNASASGNLVPVKIDPALLARASRRLAGLEGRIWAKASYRDNVAVATVFIAIPYEDEGREAIFSEDIVAVDGTAFETAFQELIDANLPRLLRKAQKAAAETLLAAHQKGEVEV